MRLLKDRKAWLRWKREEIPFQDPVKEPASFPCFAYTTVRSFGYEELNENYLYTNDVAKMNAAIGEVWQEIEKTK